MEPVVILREYVIVWSSKTLVICPVMLYIFCIPIFFCFDLIASFDAQMLVHPFMYNHVYLWSNSLDRF